MGATVSSEDERPESVYAKKSFETYSVQDVYKACTRAKIVMAPIMRERRAKALTAGQGTTAKDGSSSSSSEEDGEDSEGSSSGSESDHTGPLKSLFGVDMTFSDYFNVFGTCCAHVHVALLCSI